MTAKGDIFGKSCENIEDTHKGVNKPPKEYYTERELLLETLNKTVLAFQDKWHALVCIEWHIENNKTQPIEIPRVIVDCSYF